MTEFDVSRLELERRWIDRRLQYCLNSVTNDASMLPVVVPNEL